MEEKVVCATLLRRYQIQSVHTRDKIHLLAELVIRSKQGLRVRFRERPPAHSGGSQSTGATRTSSNSGPPPQQHWLNDDRLFDEDMRLHSI